MLRAGAGALLMACAFATVGYGRLAAEEPGDSSALSYMPARGALVIVLTTDFRSEQYRTFDRRVVRPMLGARTERFLKGFFSDEDGLKGSYARDVRPQLGSDLVVAVRSASFPNLGVVAAFEAKDAGRLRHFVERQGLRRAGKASGATLYAEASYAPLSDRPEPFLALEGKTVVVADTEQRLRRALARHDNGNGLTGEGFARRLGDLPPTALFRATGDLRPLLERQPLRRFTRLPWVRGIKSFAATLGVAGTRFNLDGAVNTDPAHMSDADLPIAGGGEAPAIIQRPGWISAASRDQSQTTVFLLEAARAGFQKSAFVRDVARVERRLGIDFEKEVLQQFDGPSATLLGFDGSFAARSTVSDPQRLALGMRLLQPYLGKLVEDLQGLQDEGLSLLLLFAPDAPASPTSYGPTHVKVEHLRGQRDFYVASGLDPELGPRRFYFGLERGVFVIGSSERGAKAMAGARGQPPADLRGGSVTDTDLGPLRRRIKRYFDADLGRLGRMSGWLNATRARLRASLSVELR